ncbi:extradiol dioxygenase, type I [Pseudonocardia sp. Ae406_Ps2]|uniref:VOC family protein n=1 Tax=unclassified Pseudonocardia TaxID=2619320 RepID=UPI00094B024D|nr:MULTISPECIES: VOC family protein [unclassified Pseudonocardia]OLL98536.1 extradiol dioxygenase, type I [Pseudonocardia sp. Ae331_Ps2]OLM03736.1 extradiol dioxygenase, type I [Pseudonocardia sp. Ae406_Ps2]OLM11407.1 extradiol dioxygenase, type I [Pseudonocardia sp. Ae505_Ps2]OLM25295.1 extradiol dioxygenase, type I [Pseudonocardia sp. Ae706_Ps2]OLM34513.1 extradiol dioxygenase, type I [Pseudonocardia sp. Ae717_Ps2]
MTGATAAPGAVVQLRSLRSATLRTPALRESADFYAQVWGLETTDTDTGAVWLRGTGPEHHILQLVDGDSAGLDKIAFAVGTSAEVDAAARELERRGIPVVAGPGPLDQAGGGYGLRLVDPEGRLVELSCDTHAVVPGDPEGRAARPRKLAHVVLNTVDIDAACSFYTGVLGMRISDWSEHQMAFLRCGVGPTADHHVIAFNQAAWTSINHVAYEMGSIDHFMRGVGRLRHHELLPLWGPGRHGPGNNTFSYFADPAGLVCEYTSEVDQVVEDAWLCRVWRRTPELSDLWGTAGPPSVDVRTRMAGTPDPGWIARNASAGVRS